MRALRKTLWLLLVVFLVAFLPDEWLEREEPPEQEWSELWLPFGPERTARFLRPAARLFRHVVRDGPFSLVLL